MVVWWSTTVEVRSAIERLTRAGLLQQTGHAGGLHRLEGLRPGWREIMPSEALRGEAEMLLGRYPLKGADALQLAAAVTWSRGNPKGRTFISFDVQLLFAAQQLGFNAISS